MPLSEKIQEYLQELPASLPAEVLDFVDWSEEAERRVAQIAQGEVGLVSGEEVFTKIREQYHR